MNRHIAVGRTSERGSALIVTLMVILAMTGLGALAFNTAIASTRTADNFGMQKRAAFSAEVAMLSGVEFLDWNLTAVLAYTRENETYEFQNTDSIRSDITVGDFFGSNPFERQGLTPFFRVVYGDVVPARRAAEFDESFCYMRVSMTGDAGIRDPARTAANANVSVTDMSGELISREFVGHFFVGPVDCPGYGS